MRIMSLLSCLNKLRKVQTEIDKVVEEIKAIDLPRIEPYRICDIEDFSEVLCLVMTGKANFEALRDRSKPFYLSDEYIKKLGWFLYTYGEEHAKMRDLKLHLVDLREQERALKDKLKIR